MITRLAILLGVAVIRLGTAATLKGRILENELGGSPMANVTVAAEGANPTATHESGQFSLEFPGRRPGDKVFLIVTLRGYVVVNDLQLELNLPSDASGNLLTLLLCAQDRREEMARRFYRLKLAEAIEKGYKKGRLEDLEKRVDKNNATDAKRDLTGVISPIGKMSEEFAQQQGEDAAVLSHEALRVFGEGKIESALQILNESDLNQQANTARSQQPHSDKVVRQAAQSYLLKARLLTTQFRFTEATSAYEAAVQIAPDDFGLNYAFATFNTDLNRFGQTSDLLEHCLKLARTNGDIWQTAIVLNDLGNLQSNIGRLREASADYDAALKIFRELAENDPETNMLYVAGTLSNIGLLYSQHSEWDEADIRIREALQILRKLSPQNRSDGLWRLANTLNNLATVEQEQGREQDARKNYEEALRIYRGLARTDPRTYLWAVATVQGNLAGLKKNQKELGKALSTYRKLAEKNPESYMPSVALTLYNLAVLHYNKESMRAAAKEAGEALKIYRPLANKHPEVFNRSLYDTLDLLGDIYSYERRIADLRKIYGEELEVLRELAKKDPYAQWDFALVLEELGKLELGQNRIQESRRAFEEALTAYESLGRRLSVQFGPTIAALRTRLNELPKEPAPSSR